MKKSTLTPAGLVSDASAFYIAAMIGRPCKPDPDVNWLWRTLLPNTPLPACGTEIQAAGSIDEGPDRDAHASEQAGRSWLRKFWAVSIRHERK